MCACAEWRKIFSTRYSRRLQVAISYDDPLQITRMIQNFENRSFLKMVGSVCAHRNENISEFDLIDGRRLPLNDETPVKPRRPGTVGIHNLITCRRASTLSKNNRFLPFTITAPCALAVSGISTMLWVAWKQLKILKPSSQKGREGWLLIKRRAVLGEVHTMNPVGMNLNGIVWGCAVRL